MNCIGADYEVGRIWCREEEVREKWRHIYVKSVSGKDDLHHAVDPAEDATDECEWTAAIAISVVTGYQ